MDTLFIINPISGNGRKKDIISLLEAEGLKYVITKAGGEAEEIARNCDESTIVAVGGDGTVNEVARGLLGSDKTLGIIPCGSGNDFAAASASITVCAFLPKRCPEISNA